jgi:hypothetical protein
MSVVPRPVRDVAIERHVDAYIAMGVNRGLFVMLYMFSAFAYCRAESRAEDLGVRVEGFVIT